MTEVLEVRPEDFIYKPDTFGTLRAIGIDKYPGEMPIVRELLQNADDAEATLVRFRVYDEKIVVENNGRPFTMPGEVKRKEDSDFYRVSHIGLGKTEEEMTGIFGVGFTAVFHLTDNPRIVSNGWDFEIHVDRLPVIKKVPFDKVTRIHLPLRLCETELSKKIGAEAFDFKKKESFERELPCEIYRDIFFLKKVSMIEVYRNESKIFSTSKKIKVKEDLEHGLTCEHTIIQVVTILDDRRKKVHTEQWQMYSLDGIDIPLNLQGLRQTLKQKVAIAIPQSFHGSPDIGKFDAENYAYYTLPVMSTGFNFKYNASKLFVTSGRSEFVVKEGLKREWNLWHMDNLAQLLALVINELISKGATPNMIYKFVPDASQIRNSMDECIFNSFKSKVESKEIRLFYTSQGKWREKENIWMNWNGLHDLLPEESGRYLINPKLRKYKRIFESYGINEFGLRGFIDYLESRYGTDPHHTKQSEDPERIRKIFEYLERQIIESPLIERLRRICILLTSEGILRSYEYGVYFPTDEEMPLISKDDILHHLTYSTKSALKFLKDKLKVKKMNLHYLIADSFIPRLSHYTADEKFEFVWYLVKRQRDILRNTDTVQKLRGNLQNIILIESVNEPNGPVFFADAELREIFKDKLNYISPKYEEQARKDHLKWRGFFERIGIKTTPGPDKISEVVEEISLAGYSAENSKRIELLLNFLSTRWRRFYSKHATILRKLGEYAWMPTTKQRLMLPTEIYVGKHLSKLVGQSQNFLEVKKPKNNGLVKVLGLLTEARLRDVCNFILEHQREEKGERDKPVEFRVYSFLNKKVDSLGIDHLKALTDNRTIWFKGRLWKPSRLFNENYQNEFGPNGWLRGYLQEHKLSKLHGLCLVLGINREAKTPDDYLDWLMDLANETKFGALTDWKIKLVRNAYSKLAQVVSIISDEQLEKLRHKKIMLTSEPRLRLPSECYLLRKGEEIIYKRIVKADMSVPIVEAESAEHEKLYSRFGVNKILNSLSAKRADKNEVVLDEKFTQMVRHMIPWLDGFEYSLTGSVSEHNLAFQQLKVYRVKSLEVLYSLKSEGFMHIGKPIEDLCCLEDNVFYMDQNFQIENIEHLQLLSISLVKNLNPAINNFMWSLVIPSLLVQGKIIGISPYDRELREQKEAAELVLPRRERPELNKIQAVAEILESKVEPVVVHEPISKESMDRLMDEVAQVLEEESLGLPVDISKMYRKKRDIAVVKSVPSVRFTVEAKISAPKNWKPMVIDGEKVYIEEGMPLPAVDEIKELRKLARNIVEAMGFNHEIVNICVAPPVTDGYNEDGQLFFNAARNDSPFRWFGVVARELAYNHSRQHYPHVRAMIDLIARGLQNIDKIFPEFIHVKKD